MADSAPAKRGALARWSRRKADAAAGAGNQAPQPRPADDPSADSPPTDADMPPLDSLNEDSDFSGFLSPGVSDGLRQAALRKLFRSAGFNLRDGLDDYDDDFRSFTALGDLITSDMKHQIERAEERRRARMQAEEDEAARDEEAERAADDSDADERRAPSESRDSDADDLPQQPSAPES